MFEVGDIVTPIEEVNHPIYEDCFGNLVYDGRAFCGDKLVVSSVCLDVFDKQHNTYIYTLTAYDLVYGWGDEFYTNSNKNDIVLYSIYEEKTKEKAHI